MGVVAAAEAAILAELQAIRGLLLVFLRVVVPALAVRARHHDHHAILFLRHLSPKQAAAAGRPTLNKRTGGPFDFLL